MRLESSTILNSFLFSMPEMTQVFSAEAQLRAMARFECALSWALEAYGLAEAGSGAALEPLLDAGFIDIASLMSEARRNGNIAIPFVRQLTAAVKAKSEAAARTVHLGATSQDVLDTALVLQMREAVKILEEQIARLERALVRQIETHAETILTARTWLQAGPPTTLGLKLAGTLAAVRRSRARIGACSRRLLVLEFGGAVGTLAALGEKGSRVTVELARRLDIRNPELPWHTQRDNLAEIVEVLGVLTGSLAKFAKDIALLMQSEVGEVSEGEGGGSSTMPHKHNPVACAAVLAIHGAMPGLVATMLAAMPQEHERGLGLWQMEWETAPAAFCRAAAALAYAIDIAEGVQVDAAKMQANLDASLGLPMAEAVSVALAGKLGKVRAHELLREATTRAQQEQAHLAAILKQVPEVKQHLTDAEIDRLLDPRNYLGSAREFIARVLGDADADR